MNSLDYHESTKHSWERIRANPHSLDFANMPLPFKIYSDVARQPLPTGLPDSAVPTLAALAEPGARADGDRVLGRNELARLLSAVGITKRRRYPGGEILFRGASCTGALYHIEVYVVCADLQELPAGVYQFQPKDFSVCLLRAGDYRQAEKLQWFLRAPQASGLPLVDRQLQTRHETLARPPGPHVDIASSRPGESHPEALTEPCVNLSTHTAPPMQPYGRQCANVRTG